MASLASPRALLLDLDGTLADSLSTMRHAYRKFLEKFHAIPTDAEFNLLNGPPLSDVVHHLKTAHSLRGSTAELLARYVEIIDEVYAGVVPSLGAGELLQKASVNQCTVGVVTSNTSKRTRAWLESAGLSRSINFIVSGDEVRNGKPDPEPYLLGAMKASCAVSAIIAVEDSPQGAQSAISAGLRTFVVTGASGENLSWPPNSVPMRSLGALAEHLW